MKKALKILLIIVLCLGLLGGGVFAYFKFRKVPPCEVYPAMQWMMSYLPNQSYLYGIVTSDASQIVTKSMDRTVLEILDRSAASAETESSERSIPAISAWSRRCTTCRRRC